MAAQVEPARRGRRLARIGLVLRSALGLVARLRLFPWVLAVAAAVTAVSLFGRIAYQVSAFKLAIDARVAWPGTTSFSLPPIGTVSAHTHAAPVGFFVTLTGFDLDVLRHLLSQTVTLQSITALFREQAPLIARAFLLKTLLLGGLGGAAGFLAGGRALYLAKGEDLAKGAPKGAAPGDTSSRRRSSLGRRLFSGFAVGVLTVAVLVAAAYATFSPGAFQQPQYEGALEAAPWMIGFLDQSLTKLGDLGQQLQKLAANINSLFQRVDELGPLGSPSQDLRLLHISDLHGNPAGFDFVRQVAGSFKVDAIIDTGDITDFGTPVEARVLGKIAELDIPYFFVSGNHDSPTVLRNLSRLPNVTVLDDRKLNFRGLSIEGIADPGSRRSSPEPVSEGELRSLADELRASLGAGGGRPGSGAAGAGAAAGAPMVPDVLAVHNQRLAAALAGAAPVILHGHDHKLGIQTSGGSVIVDAGTTGAAGLRGLSTEAGIPYSMAVLYFRMAGGDGRPRLSAVDTIRVYGSESGFTIERRLFAEPAENHSNIIR